MSNNEITVEQYNLFLHDTGHPEPPEWKIQLTYPEKPVIFVSWYDAVAFAEWINSRLPEETEWEYASRGGLAGKKYPWGQEPPLNQANYGHSWEKGKGWEKSLMKTGSFSPNNFGLNDMSGNVWEWCSDTFGPYPKSTVLKPAGNTKGNKHVVRGGAWNSSVETIRNSVRGGRSPDYKGAHTGFRVARDI